MEPIKIRGLKQNNLKNISLDIPKNKIPKYEKPNVEWIDNLNPSVIIDQTRLGGNARSTVGTISDMYSLLRLLFSRIGSPTVGPASYFSFNNPNGMCQHVPVLEKLWILI